jgi:hypothetical protein
MKKPIDLARQFLIVADNDIKEIVNVVRQWVDEQIKGSPAS